NCWLRSGAAAGYPGLQAYCSGFLALMELSFRQQETIPRSLSTMAARLLPIAAGILWTMRERLRRNISLGSRLANNGQRRWGFAPIRTTPKPRLPFGIRRLRSTLLLTAAGRFRGFAVAPIFGGEYR